MSVNYPFFASRLKSVFGLAGSPGLFLENGVKPVVGTEFLGDWEVTPSAVASWVCPEGLFEVYVNPSTGNSTWITLNGVVLQTVDLVFFLTLPGMWYPMNLNPWVTFDNAGTPVGAGCNPVACSEGWSVSTGDVLASDFAFKVRFRRVR